MANLKSGDVDIINLVPLPQARALAKEAAQPGARFRLLEHGAFAWTGISLNVTKPPFDNKLLRQALAATIDQAVIANVVLQGAGYPAYAPFPNGTPAYDPAWTLPPQNIALAKEKLQAAGQPSGFGFTLSILPGQQRVALAQAVQAMAADAGIQTKIEILEQGTFVDRAAHVQLQAGVIEWSGRPDPISTSIHSSHSRGWDRSTTVDTQTAASRCYWTPLVTCRTCPSGGGRTVRSFKS